MSKIDKDKLNIPNKLNIIRIETLQGYTKIESEFAKMGPKALLVYLCREYRWSAVVTFLMRETQKWHFGKHRLQFHICFYWPNPTVSRSSWESQGRRSQDMCISSYLFGIMKYQRRFPLLSKLRIYLSSRIYTKLNLNKENCESNWIVLKVVKVLYEIAYLINCFCCDWAKRNRYGISF